jgi:hypothetical protein
MMWLPMREVGRVVTIQVQWRTHCIGSTDLALPCRNRVSPWGNYAISKDIMMSLVVVDFSAG